MSYEYSATSQRFEIPNPYRVENAALILCGLVACIAGFVLLMLSRSALGDVDIGKTKGLLVAFGLLALGLLTIGIAFTQLRYFFGRGRPQDLVADGSTHASGPTRSAAWLKENLRQNALLYAEPKGPISGLVHAVFDTLIFAPQEIRRAAETQCFNLLFSIAILLGFTVAYFLYPNPTARSWVALAYLICLVPKLLWPFRRGTAVMQPATISIVSLLLIIGIAILLPQLVTRFPNLSRFELPRTLMLTLMILILAQAAFFFALAKQLRARPAASVKCEQRAISMNANPAKLLEELERQLQTQWVESVPNRRYAHKRLPEILPAHSGSFEGEALEETQPVPVNGPDASFMEQLLSPRTLPITVLNILMVLSYVAGVWLAFVFGRQLITNRDMLATSFLALVLMLAAYYCWNSARTLWGRVDFQSTLLWIELQGSFEEAQVNIGNQLTSAMSSGKKVINVENMTLKVWAAELDTVVFSKDGERDVIGMRGRPDIAAYYADHLTRFAAESSAVVAPTSHSDRERINAMASATRQLGESSKEEHRNLSAVAASLSAPTARVTPAQEPPVFKECLNQLCRRPMPRDAAFCSACGTAL